MKEKTRGIGWFILLIWAAGCARVDSGAPNGAGSGAAPQSGSGGTATVLQGADAGSQCPANNLTQQCSCPNAGTTALGRQVCNVATGWANCECAKVVGDSVTVIDGGPREIGNKYDVTFAWQEKLPGKGVCKAGHYNGAFGGFYNSGAMVASPVGIPILGFVNFDLLQTGNGEYFEIKNGSMIGCALAIFPFVGEIVGHLDCTVEPPLVDAQLKRGSYNVAERKYYFQGIAVGNYDKATSVFTAGEWAVTEPLNAADIAIIADGGEPTIDYDKGQWDTLPHLDPNDDEIPLVDMFVYGGAGNWDAEWVGPATGIPTTNKDGCAMVAEQDAGVGP